MDRVATYGHFAMGFPNFEALSDWEGDTEELARIGGEWCAVLRIDPDADLSVRLVRDYAQRGILDKPRRDGKNAIYGWEHLIRLLAARMLLRDGWPLQKITDEFSILSSNEIRSLLPSPAQSSHLLKRAVNERRAHDPALVALDAIKSRGKTVDPDRMQSKLGPTERARISPIADRTALPRDLAALRQVSAVNAGSIQSSTFTRLEIADGIELNISSARLRSIGRTEAYDIARAVIASLLSPRHRKEDKSE